MIFMLREILNVIIVENLDILLNISIEERIMNQIRDIEGIMEIL